MKKVLLGAFALFTALAVNAQNFEVGHADGLGLSSDTQELTEETVVHTGTNVVWYLGVGNWKKSGDSTTVTVTDTEGNSQTVGFSTGATSDANPQIDGTGISGTTTGLPNTGTYVKFAVNTDGYLYVLGKYSAQKVYVVWEDSQRIPYYYAAADEASGFEQVISFDLKDVATLNEDGSISEDYEILKPDQYTTVGTDDNDAACVVKFPVSAGKTYTFCGAGTKASISAYVFAASEDEITITYGDYTLIEPTNDGSGNSQDESGNDDGTGQDEGDGTITLPNTDVVTCTFASNDDGYYATNTDNFTFGAANSDIDSSTDDEGNLNYGSVTIDGTEYTVYYKLASYSDGDGAYITFTTKEDNTTLTLVFGPNDDLSGDDYIYISPSASKQYVTGQVFTYTCETAGEYTITKGGSQLHIFYIGLDKDAVTTGINGVTLQTTGNNVYYNLAGQRVSAPTKGVYILNGKKVLVK